MQAENIVQLFDLALRNKQKIVCFMRFNSWFLQMSCTVKLTVMIFQDSLTL